MLRVRVVRKLRREAEKVWSDMRPTSGDVIRMMFKQLVKRRAIPFPIQTETPEAEVTGPRKRRAAIMDQLGTQSRGRSGFWIWVTAPSRAGPWCSPTRRTNASHWRPLY